MRRSVPWLAAGAAAALVAACAAGPTNPMSFFVTSTSPSQGTGNLGGIAGADKYCQQLAESAGAGGKTWHAYLSAPATGSSPAVNARDRIGNGPWVNQKGVVIARNLDELHGNNNISRETALTEKGGMVKDRSDPPNQHDILTGSTPDGRLVPGPTDRTCNGWTSADQGSAMVGHVNRTGTNPDPVANASWNSSHPTPGCSAEAIARVGGGGLFYCFAAK